MKVCFIDNCGFITLQQLRFAQLERHLMRKKVNHYWHQVFMWW